MLVEREPVGSAPQSHRKRQHCEAQHRWLAPSEEGTKSAFFGAAARAATLRRCYDSRPWNQVTQNVQRSLLLHGKGKFTSLDSRLLRNVVILFDFPSAASCVTTVFFTTTRFCLPIRAGLASRSVFQAAPIKKGPPRGFDFIRQGDRLYLCGSCRMKAKAG